MGNNIGGVWGHPLLRARKLGYLPPSAACHGLMPAPEGTTHCHGKPAGGAQQEPGEDALVGHGALGVTGVWWRPPQHLPLWGPGVARLLSAQHLQSGVQRTEGYGACTRLGHSLHCPQSVQASA